MVDYFQRFHFYAKSGLLKFVRLLTESCNAEIIFTEFYKIGINKSGLMKFHVDNRQSISELVNLEPDG